MNIKKVEAVLSLPPSSNHIYINRRGGRLKSTEARTWENNAVREIIKQTSLGFHKSLNPDNQYLLAMIFYFKQIINKGWNEKFVKGVKKGERKANNKWKKFDLTNRVKLAEDAMKIATGVDDSSTMATILIKKCDPEYPRLIMKLINLDHDVNAQGIISLAQDGTIFSTGVINEKI